MTSAAVSVMRFCSTVRCADAAMLDSATTITLSVPLLRSSVPKTATHPLRIPGISPMAASTS